MKVIKNYKLWIILSVSFLLMFVAVCIYFSGHYAELERYREKEYDNSEQKQIITQLTDENRRLKSEQHSENKAENLSGIITAFVDGYYTTNGNESENDKINKIRKYITDDLYDKMYSRNEMEISYSPDEQIKQYASIKNSVYQSVDSSKILAFATVEVLFEFPDGSRDKQNIILQMEFEYDADASIWKISDIQSSAIKLQSIGR